MIGRQAFLSARLAVLMLAVVMIPWAQAQDAAPDGAAALNKNEVLIGGFVHALNAPVVGRADANRSLVLMITSYQLPDGRIYYFRSPWSTLIIFGKATPMRWNTGAPASLDDLQRGTRILVTGRDLGGAANILARNITLLRPDDGGDGQDTDKAPAPHDTPSTESHPAPPAGQVPAQAPDEPEQSWPCNGAYPGVVTKKGQHYTVTLQRVASDRLDSYALVRPLTGGNRVFAYFDTQPTLGAEYCLFIYKDTWTLRRSSTQPGFFNVELAQGDVHVLNTETGAGVTITFDAKWITEDIQRCWNVHMAPVRS